MRICIFSYIDITGKTDLEESVDIAEDKTIVNAEEAHEATNGSSSRFFRWNRIFGLSSGNPYTKGILNLEHEDDLDSDNDESDEIDDADDASCSSDSANSDSTTEQETSDVDNNGQMSEFLKSIL